jgi:protein-S-isoprenylcysteine O-methyltransferase Ste14
MQVHWMLLASHVVYLSLAFGWRSWSQWRQTGSTGFHGLSGAVGSPAWWGGVLLIVAMVLAGVTPLVVAVDGTSTWTWPLSVRMVGAAMAMIGALMTIAAQVQMGNSWRIGVDDKESTELVSSGLFGVVRNPIFTAMLMYLLGTTMWLPCASSLLAFAAAWLGIQLQVRVVEEPYLIRVQGERYQHYAARVGRFIPMLGRLRWNSPRR